MVGSTLITGGGGLLGRWVQHHWHVDGTLGELVAPDRQECDMLLAGNPTELISRYRPDRVIHLAWCASGTRGYRSSADNDRWVTATLELARVCQATDTTVWFTGTGLDNEDTNPDVYVAAKYRLRQQLATPLAEGSAGWLRPFYVFDDVAGRPGLVADALLARDEGRSVILRSPFAAHDFIHASDVGAAIVHVVRAGLLGTIDVGTGLRTTVEQLVTRLGARWQATDDCAPQTLGTPDPVADAQALRSAGWQPHRTEEFLGS